MSFHDRAEGLEAQDLGGSRPVRVVIPAPGAAPERLLALEGWTGRGMWAHGGAWLAHRGGAAVVTVTPDDGVGSRFLEVRERARAVLADPVPDPDGSGPSAAPPLRLYGGFAFLDQHRATGAWSGFEAARFVLPSVELEGGPEGTWLRVQALVSPEEGVEEARRRLRGEAEKLRGMLLDEAVELEAPGGDKAPALDLPEDPGARATWETAVVEALEAIREGSFSKVVLARILDVEPEPAPDPLAVLRNLRLQNPEAHVFLFEPRPGSALVGAAPEILATLLAGDFHATAVAGSVPRGLDPEEQAALAARLLASRKDRAEHEYTVRDMVERASSLVADVSAEPEPQVLTLAGIQHLETHLRGRAPRDADVLELLEALHPTPAVCGFPRDPALAFLRREEPFERGWYAGPVGWFDARGNGRFVPALRAAVVQDGRWRLFAGAGIVTGSEPVPEWEETGIKLEPILRALAASAAP